MKQSSRNPMYRTTSSLPPEDVTQNDQDSDDLDGLILIGKVTDRKRRYVPQDNPTTEIVTYTIEDSTSRKYFLDDYAPTGYFELNDMITIPVYIKAFTKRNGDPSFQLNVQKSVSSTRGERF